MAKRRPIKVKEKWKGKEWYQIISPKYVGGATIGETMAADPKNVLGRVVEASLIDLKGDPGKYYLKLFFKIKDIDGTKAITRFFGHTCTKDFVARSVQIRTSRIDTNNIIDLKDGKMRVKTLAVSNRAVRSNVKAQIRQFIVNELKTELPKLTTEEFVKELIAGKFQQGVRKKLNKIYPTRTFEFRKTEIIE